MRAEIRFALGLGLALAGIVVACEESSAPNITQRSNTSGGTSGSTSGGITPPAPDPNFDPNSLLDSGSSLNAGAVCKGVAIGNGTVDQENLVETGAVHLQPTTGDRDRGDFVFRTYMQP